MTAAGQSARVTVPLHRIAHARAGDKGNRLNISVIAWHEALYPLIREQVTVERVRATFAHRAPGAIERFELPRLWALNFVIDDVLEGGVNDALNLDGHGKTHSFLLLAMTVDVPRSALPAHADTPGQAAAGPVSDSNPPGARS